MKQVIDITPVIVIGVAIIYLGWRFWRARKSAHQLDIDELNRQIVIRKQEGVNQANAIGLSSGTRVSDIGNIAQECEEWLAELLRDAQNDGRISAKEARELHIKWSNENDAVVARKECSYEWS